MKGKMKKVFITIGTIMGVLFVLNLARYAFMDVHPIVFAVFSPVIITVIAKFISKGDGDEGKMSKAYKAKFPKNKLAFQLFSVLTGVIPLVIAVEETVQINTVLPAAVVDVGSYVYLVVLALAGLFWAVSEVVRRDFPWGIFRLMERLVILVLVCLGAFLVGKILAMTIGPYLIYIGVILIPAMMLAAVMLLWKLLWEGLLLVMYRDPEERRKARLQIARAEARRMYQEQQNEKKWNDAKPKDFWGNPYTARNQDGCIKKVRKTMDGTYVDKDGNEYREIK